MISFDSEKHLEDFICGHLDGGVNIINDDKVATYRRQFNTKAYGIIDIVTFTPFKNQNNQNCFNVSVLELKNERVKAQDIAQIARYKTFFERMSERSEFEYYFDYILLCKGGAIPSTDCCYLINECDWLDYYEFNLDFNNGIIFEHQSGYFSNKEDFSFVSKLEVEINEMV